MLFEYSTFCTDVELSNCKLHKNNIKTAIIFTLLWFVINGRSYGIYFKIYFNIGKYHTGIKNIRLSLKEIMYTSIREYTGMSFPCNNDKQFLKYPGYIIPSRNPF